MFRTLVLLAAVTVAGCSTTGNRFDTADLRFLVPGETTLQEATLLLQGEPVNVYRQANGAAIARWAHTATLATDAVYFNQELWLSFDPYGRFERIIKSNNLPHANVFEDGRRVDVPVPMKTAASTPPSAFMAPAPAAPIVVSPPPPAGKGSPIPHTTVTYPIAR